MTLEEYENKIMQHGANLTTAWLFRNKMKDQIVEHYEINARIRAANDHDAQLMQLIKTGKLIEGMLNSGVIGRPGFHKTSDITELLSKGADVSAFGDPVQWQRQQRIDRSLNIEDVTKPYPDPLCDKIILNEMLKTIKKKRK